jgi:hypothetical protein
MVAGDRSSYYHLLETGEFVDFGAWQIELKGAVGRYLQSWLSAATNSGAGLAAEPVLQVKP